MTNYFHTGYVWLLILCTQRATFLFELLKRFRKNWSVLQHIIIISQNIEMTSIIITKKSQTTNIIYPTVIINIRNIYINNSKFILKNKLLILVISMLRPNSTPFESNFYILQMLNS